MPNIYCGEFLRRSKICMYLLSFLDTWVYYFYLDSEILSNVFTIITYYYVSMLENIFGNLFSVQKLGHMKNNFFLNTSSV